MKANVWKSILGAALIIVAAESITASAVERDQSTAGRYLDDSVITAKVKEKFVEEKAVDANAIHVETSHGVVQLAGFAKSSTEKSSAERIAKSVDGVASVKNDIVVQQ